MILLVMGQAVFRELVKNCGKRDSELPLSEHLIQIRSSSSALASCQSLVSNPSVN
jgi:hypothetical protein